MHSYFANISKETWTFYAVIYEGCVGPARVKLFQFHSVIGLDGRDHNDKVVTFSRRNSFACITVKLYHTHAHTRTRTAAVTLVCIELCTVGPNHLNLTSLTQSFVNIWQVWQLWSVKNAASCPTCLKFLERVWQMFCSTETNETYSRSMTFN